MRRVGKLNKEEQGKIHEPEVDGKPNISFWKSQLEASKKATKHAWDYTQQAEREYLGGMTPDSSQMVIHAQQEAKYPIFWSSVKTIQPAIYSRTPVTTAEKMLDTLNDNIARVGCLALERLGKYLINCTPFDRVQYATRDMYILGGKTTNRICFESEISNEPVKVYYNQIPDPNFQPQMGPDGQPIPMEPPMIWINAEGDPFQGTELLQDEQGFYEESMEENLERVSVSLLPLAYDDYLHTPNARHWEEIDWIAFKSLMTRQDVEEKFGKDVADKLPFASVSFKNSNKGEEDMLPTLYATLWEIWDKRKKEVYWYCENYPEWVKAKDYQGGDPYGLAGFFPCPPFMMGTCSVSNLYPIPDYIQLRPLIDQMHALSRRIKILVRALRQRGLFDNAVEELKTLATELSEAEFIGVQNFKQLMGEGGLDRLIQFFPTDKLAQALQQIIVVASDYEQKFNELYGIPDILRGVSDPNETAAAQQLKGKFLSLRFSAIQREYQRLCRDDIELMIDLALKLFPADKIAEIVGVAHMPIEEQQVWPQVLTLLQDDTERKVRIEIETDSTITMNENADIEQRNYIADTLFKGIAAAAQAMEQNKAFGPVAMQALLYTVQGVRQGKQVEETLRKAMEQLLQQSQAPEPPDPEMMKQQAQAEAAQMKGALDQQKMQMQMQESANDAAMEQAKMALEAQKMEIETQLKVRELALEQQRLDLDSQIAGFELQVDAQQKKFEQVMSKKELELESYRVKMEQMEQWVTEMRLQREENAESGGGGNSKGTQKVKIEIGKPEVSKKSHKIVRDMDGNISDILTTHLDDEATA